MRRIARNPEVVVVQNPAVSFSPMKGRGHMRYRKRRRHNPKHSRHAYRSARRSVRRNKGRKGSYSAFVKKHKGLFKKHSFRAATKMIAGMWKRSR